MPIRLSLVATGLVATLLALSEPEGRQPEAQQPDVARFVFFSVLEGLYEDGVSSAVVDQILARETESGPFLHFVYACPICMPALDAFRVYRARPAFFADKGGRDTFGSGLSAAAIDQLESENIEVRLRAIEQLVQTWVSRRMTATRLTDVERADLSRALEAARKKGMSLLEAEHRGNPSPGRSLVKSCAFCDGAAGACRLREPSANPRWDPLYLDLPPSPRR